MDDYEETFYDAEDGLKPKNIFHVHEGIILVLHLTRRMLENMDSIFQTCLSLLKTLVKTAPSTGFGLYLINCENGKDSNGIFRLIELSDLNLSMHDLMKKILNQSMPKGTIVDEDQLDNKWDAIFPILNEDSDRTFGDDLCSVFDTALSDFNYSQQGVYTSQKLFLITDSLKPFNNDPDVKKRLHKIMKNLNQGKITVYPFILRYDDPHVKQEDLDDVAIIDKLAEFKQLFDFPEIDDIESRKYIPTVNELTLDVLEEKMLKRANVRRMTFECPLLFENHRIQIKGLNNLATVEWKKVEVFDDPEDDKYYSVKKRASYTTSEGNSISGEDLEKVVNIAGQYLPISADMVAKCMKFGQPEKPVLHVIGTRKFVKFNPSYTINKSVFVIADENSKEERNSMKFATLYNSLNKKNMMLLCWGMTRTISTPRFYYLVPTGIYSNLNEDISKTQITALAMLEIPFGDEIRKAPDFINELDPPQELDDSHILDFLIEKLMLPTFQSFSNPISSVKSQIFENQVLDASVSENINSMESLHRFDEMYQLLHHTNKKIDDDIDLQYLVNELKTRYNRLQNFADLKRQSQFSQQPPKKQKIDVPLNDKSVSIYLQKGELGNFTKNVLTDYIRSKGGMIPSTGTKQTLLDNIKKYLKEHDLL